MRLRKDQKVLLTKLNSTHSNLRTDTVEGYPLDWPVIGKSFVLISDKPLTEGANVRYIRTTEIKDILLYDNYCTFKTENSTYRLEIID